MRTWFRPLPVCLLALVCLGLSVRSAAAHAFGGRYDLPLPLWLYVTGAGAAVALSFVVMALFLRREPGEERRWLVDLGQLAIGRWLLHPAVSAVLQAVSVGLFLLILSAGFFGDQSVTRNFAPTFVWVIWWVGFAFVQALVGDLWAVVNPWDALFRWAEGLLARWRPGARLSLTGTVESWLDDGPALVAEDKLQQGLQESRSRDAVTGGAAIGPHRSDFTMHHLGNGMPADQCSTGEQKALLIAIVLANARLETAERNRAPLLLLDEVAAHLDVEHREALFEELLNLGTQAWLTGTDDAIFQSLAGTAQFLSVSDGVIRDAEHLSSLTPPHAP